MFGRKPKHDAKQLGAEIVNNIRILWDSFEEAHVSTFQDSILEKFSELLDNAIAKHGIDPDVIRLEFRSLSDVWDAGLLQMKPQILEFREMQGWLDCADVANARGEILGSGLIDHNQKMTVAAIAMADMKVWAQRSYRV